MKMKWWYLWGLYTYLFINFTIVWMDATFYYKLQEFVPLSMIPKDIVGAVQLDVAHKNMTIIATLILLAIAMDMIENAYYRFLKKNKINMMTGEALTPIYVRRQFKNIVVKALVYLLFSVAVIADFMNEVSLFTDSVVLFLYVQGGVYFFVAGWAGILSDIIYLLLAKKSLEKKT